MTNLAPEMEAIVRSGMTARGTPRISYSQFQKLQQISMEKRYVVQSVEMYRDPHRLGYEYYAGCFSYPHSEYSADWAKTVQASVDFAKLVLADHDDRENLYYQIWLDDTGAERND